MVPLENCLPWNAFALLANAAIEGMASVMPRKPGIVVFKKWRRS